MSIRLSVSSRLATAALLLLATQNLHAQEATAQATKPEGIEKASLTQAGAASPNQSAESALETNTVSPTNTSTAGLAKAIEAAAPRKWFGEFFTEGNENYKDIDQGKNQPALDGYLGVKYDFGNARALSVRQNYIYASATGPGVGNFQMDDTAINYTDGKLATILKDGSVILIARTYLPTGEQSRFVTHQAGKERLYFFETKSIGKWDLTLVELGQFFHWTQDSYMSGGKEKQSNYLAATGEFDAFYNFTPAFSLGFIAGADTLLNRPLAGQDSRSDDFYIQPTIQVIPTKGITAQVYLYNEVDTRHPTHDFALLRQDDNALQIWANVAASL